MSTSLSVVLTTHNRVEGVRAAVSSVLAADAPVPVQVVVVDDGSRPEVAAALDSSWDDERVVVVHQDDLGLTAARVTGATGAAGRWIAFLDDDDRWLPGWDALFSLMDGDDVGIVSGGAQLVRPAGTAIRIEPALPLGPTFANITAQYLAGCFAVRRDVYELAGGYLPGLSSSHQTELFIRCSAVCSESGLRVLHVDHPVAEIERRADTDRSLSNPRLLFDGTRWILARHAQRFALDPQQRSNWEGIVALNAVRLGDRSALRHAARSVRFAPRNLRVWARAALVASPVGSRRWGTVSQFRSASPSHRSPLAHATSLRGTAAAALSTEADLLFLPWRYRENPPASSDVDGTPFWGEGAQVNDVRYQDPVYRWAARMARRDRPSVIDIGCGGGHKLARHLGPVTPDWLGVDQASAIDIAEREFPTGNWLAADLSQEAVWKELGERTPDMVLCVDVIEHLPDPHQLLMRLRTLVGSKGTILLSTPDRARLENANPLGPPLNPRHILEWSLEEMRLLVESAGLEVVQVRHLLPRSYSWTGTEMRRTVYRALHRKAVPDRRNCMALLLKSSANGPKGI